MISSKKFFGYPFFPVKLKVYVQLTKLELNH